MKKRGLALAMSLLLAVQLTAAPARAAGSIYFTAVDNEILPLSDSTMPFWSGGYLYIPSSIFTGRVNQALDVAYIPNTVPELRILYRGGQVLRFNKGEKFAWGTSGDTYYPGALFTDAEVFVPAAVVADFFGLEYSVTPLADNSIIDEKYGALVWLHKPGFGLSDGLFASAATSQIVDRYAQYLREQEAAAAEPGGADNSPAEEEPPAAVEGKRIYLCLEAGANTGSLLDALDESGAQAAFFCSAGFMETQGSLLRRMAATGQAIGLLADAGDAEQTVAEQLASGNRLLERAVLGKTRLALIRGGDADSIREAEGMGFCCLEPEMDSSGYELRSAAQAEAVLRQVSALRGDVRVWLAETASAAGMRAFLEAAEQAEHRCMALTETTNLQKIKHP